MTLQDCSRTCLIYRAIQNDCGVQLSSGNSAPNSGNSHHLTIPFEGGMYSFKRQGVCVSGTEGMDIQGVCIGGLKVRIYRVRVYRGTEGTDIQSVCVSGTEGTDIQGVCVSGD